MSWKSRTWTLWMPLSVYAAETVVLIAILTAGAGEPALPADPLLIGLTLPLPCRVAWLASVLWRALAWSRRPRVAWPRPRPVPIAAPAPAVS